MTPRRERGWFIATAVATAAFLLLAAAIIWASAR